MCGPNDDAFCVYWPICTGISTICNINDSLSQCRPWARWCEAIHKLAAPDHARYTFTSNAPGRNEWDESIRQLYFNGKFTQTVAAARAAEYVQGSNRIEDNDVSSPCITSGSLQAARPAPSRRVVSTPRFSPSPPTQHVEPSIPEHTPSTADLARRHKVLQKVRKLSRP